MSQLSSTFGILASATVVLGFIAGGTYGVIRFILRVGGWLNEYTVSVRSTREALQQIVQELRNHEIRLDRLETFHSGKPPPESQP